MAVLNVTGPGVSDSKDAHGNLKICFRTDDILGESSYGIWAGTNLLNSVVTLTLVQIALVVSASHVFYFVLRPLRTPRFVCNVLGGILVGPTFLGRIKRFQEHMYPPKQAEVLVMVAGMGIVYSIFIISLKMDVNMTLRAAKRTWRFGIIPFICSFWIMSALLRQYDPKNPSMDFNLIHVSFCVASSITTFPVISESLQELNLITSELGQIALSSAMLNEVMFWLSYSVLAIAESKDVGISISILFSYWAFLLFCILVVRPPLLKIAMNTPKGKPVEQVYVVLIQLGVLIMSLISDAVGLTFLPGPLLFGLIMPNGPPLGTMVIERTEVIISHFLLPLFFSLVGINTDMYSIRHWGMIMKIQLIIIAGCFGKVVACMLISLTYKMKLKHGLVLGLILNIKGFMELIIFVRMKRQKHVDEQVFSHMVVAVIGVTTILTPLIEILYKPHTQLDKSSKHYSVKSIRMIQNTPRNSEFRIVSCVQKEENVRSIISLLDACNPTQASPVCVYVIHLIELLGKSTPFLLRADKNRGRNFFVNYPSSQYIIRAFGNYASSSGGLVTVIPYVNLAPYKNMHEPIFNLVRNKLISFLIIPFHENDQTHDSYATTAIRDLNAIIHAYAPCTVGILVDRNSRLRMTTSDVNMNVGIFFIGGPDDREALALGARMTERLNMRIKLFLFVLQSKMTTSVDQNDQIFDETDRDDVDEKKKERMLDECLIDEFKAQSIGNANVTWKEIEVEDGVKVLEAIRILDGDYDLVMVGKRHNVEALDNEEMSNFIENAQMLGVLGDMLASADFCKGQASVLVTHCGVKSIKEKEKRVASISPSQKDTK